MEESNPQYYLKQIKTGCLAQYTYYLESNGQALVVDPLRDISVYLQLLKERNAKLAYIFETHFHADFVSGHVDLSKQTGAQIVYGPNAQASFDFLRAKDDQELKLGELTLRVLHTPGHTLESSCLLVLDKEMKQQCVFTGDTLFLGDVGRPDLAVKGEDITQEYLATSLYYSLRNKLMTLDDDVWVYPGHGAGSACGKNIGSGDRCTIGKQKENNYALQKSLSKADFVQMACANLPAPDKYFFADVQLNKSKDITPVAEILANSLKRLSTAEFQQLNAEGKVWVLDSRPFPEVKPKQLKGSVNIPLNMKFAIWSGGIIPVGDPILLIVEENLAKEALERLARVGHDNIVGYLVPQDLPQDAEYFQNKMDSPLEAAQRLKAGGDFIQLDVRNTGEVLDGMLHEKSVHLPLYEVRDRVASVVPNKASQVYLSCASGGRAGIVKALLLRLGYTNVTNIGGYGPVKEALSQA